MRRRVKASSPTRSPPVPCGIMAGGPPSLLLSSSNCMRNSSRHLGVEVAIAPQWLLNSIERRGHQRRASFSTQLFPSLQLDIFLPTFSCYMCGKPGHLQAQVRAAPFLALHVAPLFLRSTNYASHISHPISTVSSAGAFRCFN